jgi:acyl carrier protein
MPPFDSNRTSGTLPNRINGSDAVPSNEEIYVQLVDILEELFEVDPAKVSIDSQLYDDLDIDSIDAVDMMVRLKEITGKRLDPENFKDVRTVGDCVDAISELYASIA